jgi:hypothetical protein
MSQPMADLNESKLEELQTKVLGDVAGSMGLIMAYMGDRLDLYSALVEPAAGDALEDNLHELGQIYYAFSTMVCTPASRAQAGEKRLTEVLREGGFTRVRRAAGPPTNMVLEARP